MCCHERREREMLGQQYEYVLWPGDALWCCFFIREFERILILGEWPLVADDAVFLCSSVTAQQQTEILPFLLSD